jgi:hypothetical protein
MAEVLADVPWSPGAVFDVVRGTACAWLHPAAPDQSPGAAPWLASWGTAAGLVSLAFALYRAVAIPEMGPAGIFDWPLQFLVGPLAMGICLTGRHPRFRPSAAIYGGAQHP